MYDFFFSSGTGHSLMVLSFVIGIGLILGTIKIKGVSLGSIWVLFVGIVFGALGFKADSLFLHFLKEFGLVLFMFTIGFQVGPSFFSSFRKDGLKLNLMALLLISLIVCTTLLLWQVSGLPLPDMVGTMSGASTNTPGMGTAQQTWYDAAYGTFLAEVDDPDTSSAIANSFAIAYPVGLVAAVLVIMLLKVIFRVDLRKEARALVEAAGEEDRLQSLVFEVTNPAVCGHRISELLAKFEGRYSVTAIERGADSFTVVDDPVLEAGDRVCADLSSESRMMLRLCFGKEIETEAAGPSVSHSLAATHSIMVTKSSLTGKKIKDLHLDRDYGVTVVRILRSGVELVALGDMYIQMGDGLKVIGSEEGIKKVSDLLGNKSSELEKPNLIPVFIGIGLGLILGAVPISFPVMGNAIHFGLAAGPLILGIIIGHFGPKWKISTYTSTSSLRMVREIGLCLLLSTVGLGAGGAFIPSLASNGLRIMLYSAIIAFVPLLITGLVARLALKQNFYTICGLLSGATTNPVALDFSSQAYRNIHPGVAYAAVYPFALFLQILSAQMLILLCV